jgi:hypothetical protein
MNFGHAIPWRLFALEARPYVAVIVCYHLIPSAQRGAAAYAVFSVRAS